VKERLLDWARAAAEPGSAGFIPPEERIAAFDLDGTLIPERPLPFVMEISTAWLAGNCPGFGERGPRQAALCRAAAAGEAKALRRRIEDLLALPFAGWELDRYRAHARRFFERHPNPLKKRPLSELVYQPQRELIALLQDKGFAVWICSGSAVAAIQAVSARHLGVEPARCIGTRYRLAVAAKDGRVSFARGEVFPGLVNLGKVKAANLKLATMRGPVIAFGNSDGDEWMLRFAAGNRANGLALVLDHDDPREFVYSRPELLALAGRRGWEVVSMRRSWARVFAP
jgi:phosphoserine phosphatase